MALGSSWFTVSADMSNYNFKDLQILCVDESRHMHAILRIIFRSMWIKDVRFCVESDEAVSLMRKSSYDILITDLELEPTPGLDFIRWVRCDAGSPDPYIPILVVTALTARENVLSARDAGATEFLAKPVSVKALHDRLVWMLENPRPFIKGQEYAGPDRRRASLSWEGADRRSRRRQSAVA